MLMPVIISNNSPARWWMVPLPDERLAKATGQPLTYETSQNVARAAWRKADDQMHDEARNATMW